MFNANIIHLIVLNKLFINYFQKNLRNNGFYAIVPVQIFDYQIIYYDGNKGNRKSATFFFEQSEKREASFHTKIVIGTRTTRKTVTIATRKATEKSHTMLPYNYLKISKRNML